MRLIGGLHCIQIRRLSLKLYKEQLYAHTFDASVMIPGEGSEGYEMWAAHTKALSRQKDMEKLTRESA